MKTVHYGILIVFVALFTGCATVPPNELVNARSAYQQASEGPAKQLAPAELHKASEALKQAEQSFSQDPDSYKTKDLAYVAQRKAEQAGTLGSIAASKGSSSRANAYYQTQQAEIVKQGKQDLSDSRQQTADAHAELDKQAVAKAARDRADVDFKRQQAVIAQGKKEVSEANKQTAYMQAELEKQAAVQDAKDKSNADLQKQQAALLKGQQDLKESEKRTADALAELAKIASLKEEKRGLVLTLSGSILFRSAQSTLLPQAQAKLDQIATALMTIRARNLIIEGHTDSQGSEAYNQGLSQRRSESVRDYLVQKGYPSNQIQSRGQGEGSPIANNSSAEGRANNRRVEIVIEREQQASR